MRTIVAYCMYKQFLCSLLFSCAATIAYSFSAEFETLGIELAGLMPSGIPRPVWPRISGNTMADLTSLFTQAITITLIGLYTFIVQGWAARIASCSPYYTVQDILSVWPLVVLLGDNTDTALIKYKRCTHLQHATYSSRLPRFEGYLRSH